MAVKTSLKDTTKMTAHSRATAPPDLAGDHFQNMGSELDFFFTPTSTVTVIVIGIYEQKTQTPASGILHVGRSTSTNANGALQSSFFLFQ